MNYYVEILEKRTGDVVETMGPMGERNADKVERGANINLNHAEYRTRVIQK